jgi:hypothetical protein
MPTSPAWVLVVAAAATAAAQSTVFNYGRGDAQATAQAAVVGPLPTNATAGLTPLWNLSLPMPQQYALWYGFMMQYGPNPTMLLAGSGFDSQTFDPVPAVAQVVPDTGAVVFGTVLEVADRTSWTMGAPAALVLGTSPSPVVITGQAWPSGKGVLTVLAAVSVPGGKVVWNASLISHGISDLVALQSPGTADLVYVAAADGSVLTVNASTGSVLASTTPLPNSPGLWPVHTTLVLSPSGELGVVFNTSALACINMTTGAVLWMKGEGSGLALSSTARHSWDAGTGYVLLPNATGVVALDGTTGTVAWVTPYPAPFGGMGALAAATPVNQPWYYVSSSVVTSANPRGGPVLYAFTKATGALAGTFTWDAAVYSAWGSSLSVDETGLALYMSVLGPLVAGAPTLPPAQPVGVGPRVLQYNASVYVAVMVFEPTLGTFSQAALTPLPAVMQCGTPQFAPGPAPGQLSAVCGSGFAAVLKAA